MMGAPDDTAPTGPLASDMSHDVVHNVDLGNGQIVHIQGPADATPQELQQAYQQSQAPDPQANGDGTQIVGAFADQIPAQASTKMEPEDVTHVTDMVANGASANDILTFIHSKGFTDSPDHPISDVVAYAKTHPGYRPGHIDGLPPAPYGDDGADRSFARGGAQGATLGTSDEIHGFLNGVGALVHGGSYGDAYNRTVDADRAQLGSDEQNHAIASALGNLAGGLALPVGLEKAGLTASMEAVALKAGQDAIAAGATTGAAKVIAARAVAKRMATEGAVYGAGYGAGTSEGGVGERLKGAAIGGAEGAAGGAALGALGIRSANKAVEAANSAPTVGQDVVAAAGRQKLDVLPADAGGPVVRGLTAATAQTPLGVLPIANAAKHLDTQAEQRLAQIGGDLGNAAGDREGIGQAALEGADKYAQIAKRAGGRLYDVAADKANGATVDLASTRDLVDQQIARLQAVPGGGQGLAELQTLRASLDKPATVQGVRDMRTEMFVSPEFRNTPVEGRMKAVVNAASKDAENSLRSQGLGDAADAYKAADNNWRQMLVNLQRNVEPIVGKMSNLKSPEGVSTALNSAMKSNGTRVGQFINSLPNEQQGIVRASMLNPLGRDKDGTFSIARFATDWNQLSPAAKRTVFGPESKAALDDLATVGGGAKAAVKYANHSNTGRVASALATGGTALAGVKTFGLALAVPYVTGRLLANPSFARWLGRASKTTLSTPSYMERLTRIARAEPGIAGEIGQFQQHLTNALASSPMNVAAADKPVNGVGETQGNTTQQQPQSQSAQP